MKFDDLIKYYVTEAKDLNYEVEVDLSKPDYNGPGKGRLFVVHADFEYGRQSVGSTPDGEREMYGEVPTAVWDMEVEEYDDTGNEIPFDPNADPELTMYLEQYVLSHAQDNAEARNVSYNRYERPEG